MRRTTTRMVIGGMFLALGGVLASCASGAGRGPAAADAARPSDFALGVTVFGPSGEVRRAGQRPARYLVEPDGWLRAAVGPGADQNIHPTLARWLDADTRDELWALAKGAGLGGEGVTPIESPERFDPPGGRRVYLVELTSGGRRISAAVSEGDPGAEPVAALADRLAELAWVTP